MATATETGSTSPTDEAKAKAAEAGERVQDAASQAQDKLHDAAGQAREQAGKATDQAKSRVRDQVDQRSTDFGGRAKGTADDLRSVGEQLRNQGKDQPAKLADQAAERIQQAGDYLERSDADRLLNDLEDFGRKRPWAVIAGGLAIGFAASRLLKTSSSERYQRSSAAGRPGATGAATASSTGASNALPRGTSTPGAGVDVGTTPTRPVATPTRGTAGTAGGVGSTGTAGAAAGVTPRTGGAATTGNPIPTTPSPLDDLAERAGTQDPAAQRLSNESVRDGLS